VNGRPSAFLVFVGRASNKTWKADTTPHLRHRKVREAKKKPYLIWFAVDFSLFSGLKIEFSGATIMYGMLLESVQHFIQVRNKLPYWIPMCLVEKKIKKRKPPNPLGISARTSNWFQIVFGYFRVKHLTCWQRRIRKNPHGRLSLVPSWSGPYNIRKFRRPFAAFRALPACWKNFSPSKRICPSRLFLKRSWTWKTFALALINSK
jgi:hypothetical protein